MPMNMTNIDSHDIHDQLQFARVLFGDGRSGCAAGPAGRVSRRQSRRLQQLVARRMEGVRNGVVKKSFRF